MSKDVFLRLEQLSSKLWNERKELDYTKGRQFKSKIVRIEKLISEIKNLDFQTEIEFLKKIYG